MNYDICYIGTHKILYKDKCIETKNTTMEISKLYEIFVNNDINPKYIVMEVSSIGINEARINCFKFNYIGLTNLGRDHLDYHLNINNYHNVKRSFIENSLIKKKNIFISYSLKKEFKGNYTFYKDNKSIRKNIECLEFNYDNLSLVYSILRKMNFKKKIIINTLKKISLENGRGEIIKQNNRKIIIDYAHHVESFEKILNNNNYDKVVVFGCGGNRDKGKRKIIGSIASKYCKYVIITKDNSRYENIDEIINDITCDIKDYITIKDRYEAIKYAINTYPSKDIYILGKGDETYIEENNLKIPFNDKNCVLNIINK